MFKLITAQTVDVATVSELKSQLRITGTSQDTMLGSLIKAAQDSVEEYLRFSLVPSTWELYLDKFPVSGDYIWIQKSPVTDIVTLSYTSSAGVASTLTEGTDFVADYVSKPCRLYEAYSKTWPTARDIPNAVVIRFTAGYVSAAAVPEVIKQAILMHAATMYENPADEVTGTQVNLIFNDSKRLLAPYRAIRY